METLSYQKAKDKMAIITLDVNGLNSPMKRHRVAEWIKKTKHNHMLPPGDISVPKTNIDSK